MKFTFLFFTLFLNLSLIAQTDFSKIDEHAKNAPRSAAKSSKTLVDYLTKNATNDLEKVRAIYSWMVDNIKYDYAAIEGNVKVDQKWADRQSAPTVLRYKKGVCQGYANLFVELAEQAGLEAIFVTGNTKKQRGRIPRTGHAWNVVKIADEWKIIDATWGAGAADSDNPNAAANSEKFFLPAPEDLILSHFPNDPIFQLSHNPVFFKEFEKDDMELKKSWNKRQQETDASFANFQEDLSFFSKIKDPDERVCISSQRMIDRDPTSAFGNYQKGECLYKAVIKDYKIMNQEATKANEQKSISKENLQDWSAELERILSVSEEAKTYLAKVPNRSKFSGNARGMARSLNKFEINARKQKSQYDSMLKRK